MNIHERGLPYELHEAVNMFFSSVNKYIWCEVVEIDGDKVILKLTSGVKVAVHKDCSFQFVKYLPLR